MEFTAIIADMRGAFLDLRPQDFAPGLFWGVWFIVLLLGFKGIDLRDDITQLCYVGIIMALGVLIGIALPNAGHSSELSGSKFVLILAFILAARIRWRLAESSVDGRITKEKTVKK